MRTGARATKQKYISIYISLYMKTFLKTGVYIYIYIYVYFIYTIPGTLRTNLITSSQLACCIIHKCNDQPWKVTPTINEIPNVNVIKTNHKCNYILTINVVCIENRMNSVSRAISHGLNNNFVWLSAIWYVFLFHTSRFFQRSFGTALYSLLIGTL